MGGFESQEESSWRSYISGEHHSVLPFDKNNYRLQYRQSVGFLMSLLQLIGKGELPVPDYATLRRRQKGVPVGVSEWLDKGENPVVGIDSTGLKVYGEGEWKVRKHGWSKHRTWRKLHVCVDLNTQEILSVALTGNDEDDASGWRPHAARKNRQPGQFQGQWRIR